jgi:hypothetical protein
MRSPDGRFAKGNNNPESESVSVFDCEPLKKVMEAWESRQFKNQLARSWQVPEALYANASEQQKADLYARVEWHAAELVDAIQQGASEAALLRMASDFHFRCIALPHVALPPPTPLSEVQRSDPS